MMYEEEDYYDGAEGYVPVNATGQIIFSILVLIFCCLPLGIYGLVMAATASSQPTEELAIMRLNTARKVNIVGLIMGLVINIISVAIYIVLLMSVSEY